MSSKGAASSRYFPLLLSRDPVLQELKSASDGKDILPVRHRLEHAFLDPLAVEQHALLVTAGSRTSRAAAKSDCAPAPYRQPCFPALASLRSALPFGRKRTSHTAIAQQAQWPFIEQASVNSPASLDAIDLLLRSAVADRRPITRRTRLRYAQTLCSLGLRQTLLSYELDDGIHQLGACLHARDFPGRIFNRAQNVRNHDSTPTHVLVHAVVAKCRLKDTKPE